MAWQKRRKWQNWSEVFLHYKRKGEDLGWCAWVADQWDERRKARERKAKNVMEASIG